MLRWNRTKIREYEEATTAGRRSAGILTDPFSYGVWSEEHDVHGGL